MITKSKIVRVFMVRSKGHCDPSIKLSSFVFLFRKTSPSHIMGLGVLETNVPGHVPGTVLLDQQAANSGAITNNLKHDKKNPKILLAPQPSEDPNDPLNWSSSLKYLVCFILFLGTIVHSASTVSSLLGDGMVLRAHVKPRLFFSMLARCKLRRSSGSRSIRWLN